MHFAFDCDASSAIGVGLVVVCTASDCILISVNKKLCFQAKDSLHQYPQTFSHFQAKNCSHRDASFRLFLYVFPPCSIGLSDGQRSSEHLSEEKRQNFQFHRWCKLDKLARLTVIWNRETAMLSSANGR